MTDAALKAFKVQVEACRKGGSPLAAEVLEILAMDFAKQGPVFTVAQDWTEGAIRDAMALRLLGGLHRLVLDGRAPALAQHFPSAGGAPGPALAADVIATVAAEQDFLTGYLTLPPQTNETGRSAILLGGFLTIAQETGLPLALREIGASAGLNLFWDRFAYETDAFRWGDLDSAVTLRPEWHGSAPPLPDAVEVVNRAGCDIAPADVTNPDDGRRMESYIWADQPERLDRLRGAMAIARKTDHRLEKESADAWLDQELAAPCDGVCTVVFHSIMWQYMPKAVQDNARRAITDAGARATQRAPLAWLRLEPPDPTSYPVLTLTHWPGGEERTLATAHFHGVWVRWGDNEPGRWSDS